MPRKGGADVATFCRSCLSAYAQGWVRGSEGAASYARAKYRRGILVGVGWSAAAWLVLALTVFVVVHIVGVASGAVDPRWAPWIA